ncbi:MAG TPA: hypothetical protein VHA76_10820 [Solirubrobacterales bacterium]|nr:hypothetical protein [Solirubrobacterales bacterium]
MSHRSPRNTAAVLAVLLAAVAALFAAASASAAKQELNGTFLVSPGKSVAGKSGVKVSGSYFRMIYPKGSVTKGPFFLNSNSKAIDKTYTLFVPGIDGGLRTGSFQPMPSPPFAPNGFSLANRIVQPLPFAGINFSLSTGPTDLQGGKKVGPPEIWASGTKLTGDLRGFTASWNSIYFNQGSPKPEGKLVGSTEPVTGTYDPKTRHYSIEWVSLIVGGPFNEFAGYWHFEGTFKPKG